MTASVSAQQSKQLHGFVNSSQERQLLTQAALACAALELTVISAGNSDCALERAIDYYRQHASPSLLILDISKHSEPLSALAQLAEVCQASTRVLLLGQRDDLGFYRQLMALGVDDYLLLPADEAQLRNQLRQLSEPQARFHNNAADAQANNNVVPGINMPGANISGVNVRGINVPRGRNMVITATHSGIGSSLISALVASKLSRDPGMHLALLDLDSSGSLDMYLNSPANSAFASLLADPDNADELLVQRAGQHLHERLTLFSSVVDIETAENQRRLFEQPQRVKALTAKLAPQFSALCWDLPAANNTTPLALELLKDADHILLITHPHPSASRELKRLHDFYQQHGLLNKVHIVVNQPYSSCAVSVEDMAAINPFINTPLSTIDHDKSVLKDLLAADNKEGIQRSRLAGQVNRLVDDWLALNTETSQAASLTSALLTRLLRRGG